MKVSNCCGEKGNVKFYETEWLYSEAGMCPKCGEHCEYVEEEEKKDKDRDSNLEELRKSEIF